jgi:hypothetical protein
MKTYIKPMSFITEVAPIVMNGTSIHNEVGSGDEFANTTSFEDDITLSSSKSLWED